MLKSSIRLLAGFVLGTLFSTTVSNALDLNNNGMGDIWEQLFDASGLTTEGDTDGDGATNGQEASAGTDPFNPESNSRILGITHSTSNVLVGIPSSLGKRYELQSLPALGSNWVTETISMPAAGSVTMLYASPSGMARFFRVAISDFDSDADGVSDWEERQVGLDPENPTSNNQLDSGGLPIPDLSYVSEQIGRHNVITIETTDAWATQAEPGQAAANLGGLRVLRAGFPLGHLTVSLSPAPVASGSAVEGLDYAALPRWLTFVPGAGAQNLVITPLANPARQGPTVATVRIQPGAKYSIGSSGQASVTILPSDLPKGTGLTGQYYTNASSTYSSTANLNPANLKLTRIDSTVDFAWGSSNAPILNNGYYSVRWTGQVQPQFSETYYFVANTDDGVKLWVNDRLIIDRWVARSATDSVGTIQLEAGVRYNLRMEYFQGTGSASARLYWYSPSQPKQIIPSNRLYPASVLPAPSVVTSDSSAFAFLGQPFSFLVTGANSPTRFSAIGIPPGLSFNPTTGLLNGTPLAPGDFQITLTSSNTAGLSASVLALRVVDTGSSVSREIWTNIPGALIKDIPLSAPASISGAWGALEGATDFGENYAERIRGYLTAPISGNYYFWIAASDSAELWISNNKEPANKVRRAHVTTAGANPRDWLRQPSQRSPWLALIAGEKYYFEVLHKAGEGTNDNWSVGWRVDPTGTNTLPIGLVPPYLLSRYFPLPASHRPGTLYNATMLAQPGADTRGFGTATLRLSGDETKAILKFNSSGLTSRITGQHIHSDPYLSHPGQIIFDIDDAQPDADGARTWHIEPIGTLSAGEVVQLLKENKAFINLHTEKYPGGEIKGYFNLASGTQIFSAPQPPPAWTTDHSSSNAAARFLIQASFGPSWTEIQNVRSLGYEGWIDSQVALPPSHHLPHVIENTNFDPTTPYPGTLTFNSWWKHSITGSDQLRQRMAFALSEIFVVSESGILDNRATALSSYYDMLLDHAFGNFRELLRAVTLHPAMGLYLDMRGNQKGDITTGRHPNENYAREVLQLFSIGLYRLWPDATLVLDSNDNLVPTYGQEEIMGFSSVFTGWNYYQPNQANGRLPTNFSPPSNYTNAMVLVPSRHDLGTKRLLDNVVLPQAWGAETNSATTNFDNYCSRDLELALDSIFYHDSVGPYICRQLIQRFVTSHPSHDYVYRVVQKFNDNGTGVRGDLTAVIKAILLDYEARSPSLVQQPGFGKQREPILRATAAARAFPPPPGLNGSYTQNGDRTITCAVSTPHRMNNGDTVLIRFTDTSGKPTPSSRRYSITALSPTVFTVNDPALLSGTYRQSPNVTVTNMITGQLVTTNVIFVTITGHGLNPNWTAYLHFASGGAQSGEYEVISSTNANNFAVTTSEAVSRTGNVRLPRLSGGYRQTGTNIVVSVDGTHSFAPGNQVYIDFRSGTAVDGHYTVLSNLNHFQFVVGTTTSVNQTRNSLRVFGLAPPVLTRSGQIEFGQSTWNMGSSDTSLTQTPLNSPTVFNFFFPDYKFPGPVAAAGLTTPEFQLSSDTQVALQMNFLANGILGNTSNTNGLSSFSSGDGDIVMDLGPWMTPAFCSNAGLPALFDRLNTLLAAGQLSPAARSIILNYVANTTNFPFSTTPTYTEMRNRVRAVAHLILVSPEFTIQR